MISYVCPQCQQRLQIPEEYAGQQGRCRKCGALFTAPTAPAISSTPYGGIDLSTLNIDPDKPLAPYTAAMLYEEPDDPMPWIVPVGWTMFAVGLVSVCAGQPLLTVLIVIASCVLAGIDLGKRERSGNVITGWVLSILMLWAIAWPLFLVKRKSASENRAEGISVARIAVLLVLVLVSVVIFIVSAASYAARSGGIPRPIAAQPAASFVETISSATRDVVTLAEFGALQNGISYSEAVRVIGAEGSVMSQNHMDGVPGVMPSMDTVLYMWQNPNGANMNAMFQNDKMIQKSQFGLR